MTNAWWGGPITGASMNPARSLGPAIFEGDLSHMPLYILAPMMGAISATLGHKYLLLLQKEELPSLKEDLVQDLQ